jgi:hypothetical protein
VAANWPGPDSDDERNTSTDQVCYHLGARTRTSEGSALAAARLEDGRWELGDWGSW